jgi:hypothetical protein
MSRFLWISLGTLVATGGVIAGASYVERRKRAQGGDSGGEPEAPPTGEPDPDRPIPTPKPSSLVPLAWDGAGSLPTASDVKGDLTRNWGRTPLDLRPLLLVAEEASNMPGAGRVLAGIATRESRFQPNAHNGNEPGEQSERNASWRAYTQNKARNPPLAFGEEAAVFGSGGLFGALAPYFLWSGIQEMGDKAPLLGADPRIMFVPRVATFAACVFMARLLKQLRRARPARHQGRLGQRQPAQGRGARRRDLPAHPQQLRRRHERPRHRPQRRRDDPPAPERRRLARCSEGVRAHRG